MPDTEAYPYDAFISYSHAADEKLANDLQKGLKWLARPWHLFRPALRIARDQTSMGAGSSVWAEIEKKLTESRYFILLASPEAAQSRWCQKEVAWWLEHRPLDTLLVAWTGGVLQFGGAVGEPNACIPADLSLRLQDVPRYVDLRWAKSESALTLRDARFRDAVLDLAVPLHGKEREALSREDIRQYRTTRGIGIALMVLIVLLAAVSTERAITATRNRDEALRNAAQARRNEALAKKNAELAEQRRKEAEARRKEAEAERNLALARGLASRSEVLLGQRGTLLDQSLFLAVEAACREPASDSYRVLRQAYQLYPERAMDIRFDIRDENPLQTVSSGGDYVAVAGRDGALGMWHVPTGKKVNAQRLAEPAARLTLSDDQVAIVTNSGRLLAGPITGDLRTIVESGAIAASYSAAGDVLAVTTREPETRLLDVPSYDEISRMRNAGVKHRVEVGRGGTELVAWDDDDAEIFDAPGPPRQRLNVEPTTWFRYSPEGRYLATVNPHDFSVSIADVQSKRRVIFEQAKISAAFSRNGRMLALASPERYATTWDLQSCRVAGEYMKIGPGSLLVPEVIRGDVSCHQRANVRHDNSVWRTALSDDGRLLGTLSQDGTIRVWDSLTGTERLRIIYGGARPPIDIAFAAGGTLIAARSAGGIRAWRTNTRRLEYKIPAPDSVNSIAIDRTGALIAFSSRGGLKQNRVIVRRLPDLEEVHSRAVQSNAEVLSFDPSGKRLALSDGAIWDIASDSPISARVQPGRFAIASDWTLTAESAPDGTISVRDFKTGRSTAALKTAAVPQSLAFDGNGRMLLIAAPNRLSTWDWRTGSKRDLNRVPNGYARAALDQSGHWIALVYPEKPYRVEVWDLLRGERIAILPHTDVVRAAAFDPAGNHVITGSDDKVARVWTVKGAAVTSEMKHDADVASVAFSPDGRYAISGGGRSDRTLRVWLFEVEQLVPLAREHIRQLTAKEQQEYLGAVPLAPNCSTSVGQGGNSIVLRNR